MHRSRAISIKEGVGWVMKKRKRDDLRMTYAEKKKARRVGGPLFRIKPGYGACHMAETLLKNKTLLSLNPL